DFHAGRAFDGLTERCAMGETRIAGNTFRQENGFVYRQLLEKFFGSLMGVKHSKLQIEYGFPCYREIEVPRFDDPRMDRPHGHLHDQILSTAGLFKDVVVEEDAFDRTAVLGEYRDQPGPEFAAQVLCDGPNVGIAENNVSFVLTLSAHRLNLLAEPLPKR